MNEPDPFASQVEEVVFGVVVFHGWCFMRGFGANGFIQSGDHDGINLARSALHHRELMGGGGDQSFGVRETINSDGTSTMQWVDGLRSRTRTLKLETLALYFAARHRDTPWYAKALVAAIVAYALSPIDLIPDFIPVLGYVDDVILLPLAIAFALRMIPPAVMDESRQRAKQFVGSKPHSLLAAAAIIAVWLGVIAATVFWAIAGYPA